MPRTPPGDETNRLEHTNPNLTQMFDGTKLQTHSVFNTLFVKYSAFGYHGIDLSSGTTRYNLNIPIRMDSIHFNTCDALDFRSWNTCTSAFTDNKNRGVLSGKANNWSRENPLAS